MKPFRLITLFHTYTPITGLVLAVAFSGLVPLGAIAEQPKPVTVENFPQVQSVNVENFPAQQSVDVANFPEVQATTTSDRPFALVGSAHIDVDDITGSVDSYVVPQGMVLVLDAASADIQQSTTVTGVTVQMRLFITVPGQSGVTVATEQKPINLQVGNNSYLSNPASWTLPPMHLPPGTSLHVQLIQTKAVFAFDYRVLVTGHLVAAAD